MLETIHAQTDDMSADVSAMPPWKRELLERKRRQEEEDRKRREEEMERLSHMPPWKRELMLKKKKTSTIYMSRSASANEVDKRLSDVGGESYKMEFTAVNGSVPLVDNCVVTVVSEETSPRLRTAVSAASEYDASVSADELLDNGDMQEEHLLPIECNPWLKLDPNCKRRGRNIYRKSKEQADSANESFLSERSSQGSYLSPSQNSYSENSIRLSDQEVTSDRNDDNDSVFDEEEVTYGKGFVHKLLRKFKHMSAREDSHSAAVRKPSPKRTHSSENILEDRNNWKTSRNYVSACDISGGYSSLSKQKAQSTDCLVSRCELEREPVEHSSERNHSGYSEEMVTADTKINETTVVQSAEMPDVSSGGLLTYSDSQESTSEEFPRTNIVSVARSVFESISTSQKSPAVRQHHSPERIPVRSSSTSNISSSRNAATAHITHSASASLTDERAPVTDCAVSTPVVNYTRAEESPDKQPSALKIGDSQKAPGSRYFFAGRRSESSAEATDVKKSSNRKATATGVDRAESSIEREKGKLWSAQASTAEVDASTTRSYSSASSGASESTNTSNSENHCPAPHVPKAQEYFDQNSRDQSQCSTTRSGLDRPAVTKLGQDFSPEAPAVSEEITLELNQSAKDAADLSASADAESNIQVRSASDCISANRAAAPVTKDVVPSINEHRNPEANRLNLNLNLNELSRKKSITDENTDINRNNKPVVQDAGTADVDDGFPVPMLRKKKVKRPASTGPGSLLIRPASNLVAAGMKAEYLCLNKYHDIKDGEFAPAKKRPSHYYDEYGDDDIPVTDVDDYLPVTNIDDVSPAGTPREGDPTQQKRPVHKFEFVGAGVIVDRSLLSKTKHKKMKLNFNDAATSTFEYPSEQSLLDLMPPEPGDFDFCDPNKPSAVVNGSADEPPEYIEATGLRPTPGVGSAGTLGSYQSKCQVDYFFGMEQQETKPAKKRQDPEPAPTSDIQPANDEDFTWSDAASSDMLF